MKSIIKYTFAIALVAFALNTNASTSFSISAMTEEAYIDDIPFNTAKIFDSIVDLSLNSTYELTEEAYIQDIPFDTKEVVEGSNDLSVVNFDLEEESYINDIPFSTEALVKL